MRKLAILLLPLGLLVGCSGMHIHPGTANSFDSAVYDTLLTADSVITTTKADLAANKFPASISGNVKTALNQLIVAYDAADVFYCGAPAGSACAANSYHSLVMSGKVTAAQTQQMQQLQTQVNASTDTLAASKGGAQ